MIRAALDESRISALLNGSTDEFYWRVRVIQETTSTQDEIRQIDSALISSGDCVITEYQSAGRGRLDRKFDSPSGVALLFSFFIQPERIDSLGWIPLIAGMSVAQTLREVTESNDYFTKWPNDVLTEYGKVAGILCERFNDGVIVGIGINVSTQSDELPVDTATSIFITSGIEIDRNELLAQLLSNFSQLFLQWDSGADLKARFRALSATIGSQVKAELPSGRAVTGTAIGIGPDGELLLESGEQISVGDITHLRAL